MSAPSSAHSSPMRAVDLSVDLNSLAYDHMLDKTHTHTAENQGHNENNDSIALQAVDKLQVSDAYLLIFRG